ncbi:Cilia- and flagella-associated protein 298 [Plecturocebus cupreus]
MIFPRPRNGLLLALRRRLLPLRRFRHRCPLEPSRGGSASICAVPLGSRRPQMEELAEHGIFLPPNMQGLTDDQIEELKLKDEWGEKCVPSGGAVFKKDDIGRRNGQAPNEKMKQVLKKTIEEAKAIISKTPAANEVPRPAIHMSSLTAKLELPTTPPLKCVIQHISVFTNQEASLSHNLVLKHPAAISTPSVHLHVEAHLQCLLPLLPLRILAPICAL